MVLSACVQTDKSSDVTQASADATHSTHPDGSTAAVKELIGCELSASEHSWSDKVLTDEKFSPPGA